MNHWIKHYVLSVCMGGNQTTHVSLLFMVVKKFEMQPVPENSCGTLNIEKRLFVSNMLLVQIPSPWYGTSLAMPNLQIKAKSADCKRNGIESVVAKLGPAPQPNDQSHAIYAGTANKLGDVHLLSN